MLSIPQMCLEIIHGLWTHKVQLPRAIMAADPWHPAIAQFQIGARLQVLKMLGVSELDAAFRVVGIPPHQPLEVVVRVVLFQTENPGNEPFW